MTRLPHPEESLPPLRRWERLREVLRESSFNRRYPNFSSPRGVCTCFGPFFPVLAVRLGADPLATLADDEPVNNVFAAKT